MGTATLDKIHDDLEFLKKKVIEIEENMVDRDAILSKDEELLIKKAREEHKSGKTVSLKELEKEFSN